MDATQKLEKIAKNVQGVWLPKDEEHLTKWMVKSKGTFIKDGKITYQWSKQSKAMQLAETYIKDWQYRTFVDVGAHVGLWSMWWGKAMQDIIAFEPIPDMQEIYRANCAGLNYDLRGVALGDKDETTMLNFNPLNTGNTHASHKADTTGSVIPVQSTTLDKEIPARIGLSIGVLKIDCEGYEEKIVRGATKTIKAHKPLIIVEQKKGASYYGYSHTGAADYLTTLGYKTLKVMSGDHLMVHESLL